MTAAAQRLMDPVLCQNAPLGDLASIAVQLVLLDLLQVKQVDDLARRGRLFQGVRRNVTSLVTTHRQLVVQHVQLHLLLRLKSLFAGQLHEVLLVVLLLGDGLGEAHNVLASGAGRCLIGPCQVADLLLATALQDRILFRLAVVQLIRRQTQGVLLAATGRARVAVTRKQRELVVHEFRGADLHGVLRLQLVRGGVLRQTDLHRVLRLQLVRDGVLRQTDLHGVLRLNLVRDGVLC